MAPWGGRPPWPRLTLSESPTSARGEGDPCGSSAPSDLVAPGRRHERRLAMLRMKSFAVRSAVLVLAVPAAVVAAKSVQDEQAAVVQGSAEEAGWAGDPYLLAIDPVTGEKLGDVPRQIVLQHEGREFRFASQETADAFQAKSAEIHSRRRRAHGEGSAALLPAHDLSRLRREARRARPEPDLPQSPRAALAQSVRDRVPDGPRELHRQARRGRDRQAAAALCGDDVPDLWRAARRHGCTDRGTCWAIA
jgi:hypothetical protein